METRGQFWRSLWGSALGQAIREVLETSLLLAVMLLCGWVLTLLVDRVLGPDKEISAVYTIYLVIKVGGAFTVLLLFLLNAGGTVVQYFRFLWSRSGPARPGEDEHGPIAG